MTKLNLKEEIFEVIKEPHLTNLATITEDGKPWNRYVIAVGSDDLTIRFSTILNLRKVNHIKKNPEVHLNCGISGMEEMKPYLQIQGKAEITTDQHERNNFWNEGLKSYFSGPEDPNYLIVIVKPYLIEYNKPADMGPPQIWTA